MCKSIINAHKASILAIFKLTYIYHNDEPARYAQSYVLNYLEIKAYMAGWCHLVWSDYGCLDLIT